MTAERKIPGAPVGQFIADVNPEIEASHFKKEIHTYRTVKEVVSYQSFCRMSRRHLLSEATIKQRRAKALAAEERQC